MESRKNDGDDDKNNDDNNDKNDHFDSTYNKDC